MNKEVIQGKQMFPAQGPHSNAVRTGNLIFIAGQGARDEKGAIIGPGDPETQTEQVMKNMASLLEAGGSSFDDVLALNIYVTDMRCREALGRVRQRFLRAPFPATTLLQVAALALPEQLVMIEGVAISNKKEGNHMQKQTLAGKDVCPPRGAYSHAVRAGNLLFIAGQTAWDKDGKIVGPGDIEAQAEQVMKNIASHLEAAGATFDNVVMLNVYLTDMRYREAVGKVRRKYMREPFPASTSVQVVALAEPDMLIEIEATASL